MGNKRDLENLMQPLSEAGLSFLASRGISEEVAKANDIRTAFATFKVNGQRRTEECLALPYRKDGGVVWTKYRSIHGKRFTQASGCEKILYGYDDIMSRHTSNSMLKGDLPNPHEDWGGPTFEAAGAGKLVIVEGELDKLACNEAGLWNVVSVPHGAPCNVQRCEKPLPDAANDRQFGYLCTCASILRDPSYSEEVYVAVDGDQAGGNLVAELSRRLGRTRCHVTHWPTCWEDHQVYMDGGEVQQKVRAFEQKEISDDGGRKDANEVLVKDGRHALRAFIQQSRAME